MAFDEPLNAGMSFYIESDAPQPPTPLVDVRELSSSHTSTGNGTRRWRTEEEWEQMLAPLHEPVLSALASIPEEGDLNPTGVVVRMPLQHKADPSQSSLPVNGPILLNSVSAAQIGQVPDVLGPASGPPAVDTGLDVEALTWLLDAIARDSAQAQSGSVPADGDVAPGSRDLASVTLLSGPETSALVTLAPASSDAGLHGLVGGGGRTAPAESLAEMETTVCMPAEPAAGSAESADMDALINGFGGSFTLQPQDELPSRALYGKPRYFCRVDVKD